MSDRSCPRESETLTAHRRRLVDAPIASHLASCAACRAAVETEETLARLAAAKDGRPFPAAAALRLELELRLEERRLARRARVQLALHAAAVAVSLALFAAARLVGPGLDARGSAFGSAGSIGALTAVVLCTFNFFRTVEESAAPM